MQPYCLLLHQQETPLWQHLGTKQMTFSSLPSATSGSQWPRIAKLANFDGVWWDFTQSYCCNIPMAGQIEVKDLHASSSIQHFSDLQPQKLRNKTIQQPIHSRREERKSIPIPPLQIQVLQKQRASIMKQLNEVKMRLHVPFIPKGWSSMHILYLIWQ